MYSHGCLCEEGKENKCETGWHEQYSASLLNIKAVDKRIDGVGSEVVVDGD